MRLFDEHKVRRVISLNGTWRFLIDEKDEGLSLGWHNGLPKGDNVIIPSAWNNELGLLNYMQRAWYEKKFSFEGGNLRIVFEAVATEATVWLDGKKLGSHFGGFSMFDFLISALEAGEHTITVEIPQGAPEGGSNSYWCLSGTLLYTE